MNVSVLSLSIQQETNKRAYISRLDILDLSVNLLKARLYISPNLFVQVYRNDHYNTTNFVLIYNRQRIYARDQLGGKWHRHPAETPDKHDTSTVGKKAVTFAEFLDEVEGILAERDLP